MDDTPIIQQWSWCPSCPPPSRLDNYWEIVYCHFHRPETTGEIDPSPLFTYSATAWAEAGGNDNRLMCDLLHRGDAPS